MGAPGDEVRGGNPDIPLAIVGDPGEEVATGWLHGCVEGRDGVPHGQPRSGAGRTRDGRGDLRIAPEMSRELRDPHARPHGLVAGLAGPRPHEVHVALLMGLGPEGPVVQHPRVGHGALFARVIAARRRCELQRRQGQ